LGEVQGELAAGERAEGADADEGAFELADVRLDLGRDEIRDLLGEGQAIELGLLLENRDPGLEVGGLGVGDQTCPSCLTHPGVWKSCGRSSSAWAMAPNNIPP